VSKAKEPEPAASNAALDSESLYAQIAEIESQVAKLEVERKEADRRATEASIDDARYLEACSQAGAAEGKVAALKDRVRRITIVRDEALDRERKGRISALQKRVQDGYLARDRFASELKELTEAEEARHKVELAKIDQRYHELNGAAAELESELWTLEAIELEREWRTTAPEKRERLEGDLRMKSNGARDRKSTAVESQSIVANCKRIIGESE